MVVFVCRVIVVAVVFVNASAIGWYGPGDANPSEVVMTRRVGCASPGVLFRCRCRCECC